MPNLIQMLQENPERPIPIDNDIKIQGLKNPIYSVIVGFSTQKVLESLKKIRKEVHHVLIIEPDLRIFHQTLRREWVGWILDEPSIDLVVGIPPQELLPHLTKIFSAVDPKKGSRASKCLTPEIIADPFAYPNNHPMIAEVTQVVTEAVRQVFVSMGCAPDSYSRWLQLIRNEKNLQNCYRIKPLFEQFKDVPVVVIGAGPSLSEFIDAYHRLDLQDRCLLIACDASLRKLLAHGIRPHIVTRCERKLTTIFRDLDKSSTQGIFYAAYPWCPPEYFDLFDSSFMLFRDNGVCRWTGYDPGSVNGGVSSANAALELAYLFGAQNIVLTGIDLCFLDGKSHIEGTEVEFDIEKSKPKWRDIPSNDGKTATSIPVWIRCLNEYQAAVFKYQGRKVYNTSLSGARIEGTIVTPWDDLKLFGEKFDLSSKIKSKLEKHNANYEKSYEEKKKQTIAYLEGVSVELTKLFRNIQDVIRTGYDEEWKVVGQIKAIPDPKQFFSSLVSTQKELQKLFSEPCRQVDSFRMKYYGQELFSHIILDICQLDLFQSENKYHALINLVEMEHERLKHYADIHLRLFKTFEFYVNKLIDLLKNGYKEENPELPDVYLEYEK